MEKGEQKMVKGRCRLIKTTRLQYVCMLDFLRKNKILLLARKATPGEQTKISQLWEDFAIKVNSKSIGAPKTPDQWKNIFEVWKANTNRKKRHIMNGTSGGPRIGKHLSNVEKGLLSLIAEVRSKDAEMKNETMNVSEMDTLTDTPTNLKEEIAIEIIPDGLPIDEDAESVVRGTKLDDPLFLYTTSEPLKMQEVHEEVANDHSYSGIEEAESHNISTLLKETCETCQQGTVNTVCQNSRLVSAVEKLANQTEIKNKLKYYEIFKTFVGFEKLST